MKDKNLNRPSKGLYTDSSYQDQPKDSISFGLNRIIETDQGDNNFGSNEESNEMCASLTPGFVPIGKVYMNNDRIAILSVSEDDRISEIGIYYPNNCEYVVYVNDEDSVEKDKLKFSVSNQIQVTYRLRRGCEDTIYFTDGKEKPKYFNFFKPGQFKNSNGTWSSNKFNLQKTYEKIPEFKSVEVLDSGGNLEPGNYNFAIQYVDESLNPTEWITTSNNIRINNSLSTEEYADIVGSINSDVDYLNFPTTGKAIKLEFNNLDNNFLYYRLAVISSNNGSGIINQVFYTEVIPISKDFFIYTGLNHSVTGTTEEILQFTDFINKAKHIEQIENRLVLANTEGSQVNFCALQKYASRIKTDCIVKNVILNDITDPANTKNPSHEFNNGLGYMPGEIYSLGIVYIFEDNSLSPVYHIPGKDSSDEGVVFSAVTSNGGNITYPMSTNNQNRSDTYSNNSTCGGVGYWGLDYNGNSLNGASVRHHRFPLRSEIGVPLVKNSYGSNQTITYYNLNISVNGTLIVPVPCGEEKPDCNTDIYYIFEIRTDYKVDGIDYHDSYSIDTRDYANGLDGTYSLQLGYNTQHHSSNNITDVSFSITDEYGNLHPIEDFNFSKYFTSSPTFSSSIENLESSVQDKVVETTILGLRFSGVEKPPVEVTNGLEVIGYYIVRNERTEFEKTILDSAVLFPSVVNNEFISHGLLQPETDSLSPDVFGILHPEHKFNNKEYVVYDKLIQEGVYTLQERKKGLVIYDDVFDGSGFQEGHKEGNDDGKPADGQPIGAGYDGWSFSLITRDNIVNYQSKKGFVFNKEDFKERFYLDALAHKSINNSANDVYNIACDNKIGIIQLDNGKTITDRLPYAVMYKENLNPYSNFRILPYYKESVNPFYFNNATTVENNIFNGDSYVSPMRYVNTMYWQNRVADRKGKTSVLKIVLGAVVALIGAALLIFTAGASSLVIGAGIAIMGAGALMASSGIKQENFNKAFTEAYDKGLRQTLLDSWVHMFYYFQPGIPFGYSGTGGYGKDGLTDDVIQWIGEGITDLWFESAVNMNHRNGFVNDTSPTFLHSPWRVESGNDTPIETWLFHGKYYTSANPRYPVSTLENHIARKLLAFDPDRDDNRTYLGIPLGEYYQINPDYHRRNKEKIYYHLPLEYDCCSDCNEKFPHRVQYSEQSFQEELSDNFRVFLPNNYRDLEGESGVITNIYRFGIELYLHTEEALWLVPRNYQERITDQIVSFIGTGEYFSIPPRKILDDDTGNSAGTQHKWSSIKTPMGIFFVSENQNKIYQFNGQNLKPISNVGISKDLKKLIEVQTDKDYFKNKRETYPFKDNPSNFYGTGFISTYDSRKERILISKKDNQLLDTFGGSNFEVCLRNGQFTKFENISDTIEAEEINGWDYIGIEDCRLKFQKDTIHTRIERRVRENSISNDAYVYAFFDTSGSFNNDHIANIRDALNFWYETLRPEDVTKQKLIMIYSSFERWLGFANEAILDSRHNGKIIVLTFVNEANPVYHGLNIMKTIDPSLQPTTEYIEDYEDFITHRSTLEFFVGINYSIATPSFMTTTGPNYGESIAFAQHTLLAFETSPLTSAEADSIVDPLADEIFSLSDKTILKNDLTNISPYASLGDLKSLGWFYSINRNDLAYSSSEGALPLISPEQFAEDINNFLEDTTSTEVYEVEVEYIVTEYKYVEGTILIPEVVNNSWTLSYDLKNEFWVSYHSYIPSFYINIPEDFFAWTYGSNSIWKFNKLGHYQNFFGKRYPFIVEFVSLSNPLLNKVWDYLKIFTEAKKYNPEFEEFTEERFVTFNKALFYNSRQTSGILNLIVKDTRNNPKDYLLQQVQNLPGDSIIIDKNEGDWSINELRDYRVDYSEPMFNKSIGALQDDYFIDKVVNNNVIDYNKDWTELESFRDKYLVVRLIFDNFDDIKLLLNYSVENENQSFR